MKTNTILLLLGAGAIGFYLYKQRGLPAYTPPVAVVPRPGMLAPATATTQATPAPTAGGNLIYTDNATRG